MIKEEAIKKVNELREYLDFTIEMAQKYGCTDNMRKSIKDTEAELSKIENINTMRQSDFARFANGDFGFI